MATSAVKSKPLHNFSLPFLKWAHKNYTNRCRRPTDSTPQQESSDPNPEPDALNCFPFESCSAQKEQTVATKDSEDACGEGQGSAAKPWNLRPKKAVVKRGRIEIGEPPRTEVPPPQESDNGLKLSRNQKNGRREKKPKLWISLSKDEIEEDVYSLTGSRPARRHKKRAKTVQKHLDNVFPGLYLVGTTADSYRVQNF